MQSAVLFSVSSFRARLTNADTRGIIFYISRTAGDGGAVQTGGYAVSFQTVIFDLDGTLLNTLDDLHASVNAALGAFSLPLRTREEVRRFVGNGIRLLIERAVPEHTPPALTDRVFAAFRTHYGQHCMDRTRPYEGIVPLLQALRRAGVHIAVVSNKADAAVQPLIARSFGGLAEFVLGEKTGVARKPAPDMAQAAMDFFACPKDQAVFVGDSDVDIQTAANAGIDCISVCWGFRTRQELKAAGAVRLAATPAELQALLL